MAVGQDGANQVGQFVGQEGVKGDDGRQATIDGSRVEALGGLGSNKSVYIVKVMATATGRPQRRQTAANHSDSHARCGPRDYGGESS
jgi:hypothetical protein